MSLYPEYSALCSSLDPGAGNRTTHTGCLHDQPEGSWCYTRTYPNGSGLVGYFGHCDPSCAGEMPTRRSPHNLAGSAFDHLWTTRVFSLTTWSGPGICHTYNPPGGSLPGPAGLLYALIGDSDSNAANISLAFRGLDVYLHDKFNFWPGSMAAENIKIGLNENVEIKFIKNVGTYLSGAMACTEEATYSLTNCLQVEELMKFSLQKLKEIKG
jgi:hypothetical protein